MKLQNLAEFWSEFSKNNWEKKALALKKPAFSAMEIKAEDIFSFLLRYSDHCRKNNTTDGLKLYVDGQLQYESELIEALPVSKDKSLNGYHQRMSKIYDDYCLVCDELSQGSGEKWQSICEFLLPLYEKVGIPNKYAEIGLYLGNYKKTPFGVHVDGCGVFSFPVVGTKHFRIWDPKFVEKNPDLKESFNYQSYNKHSQLLKVGVGDMAYWPSQAWHIAESDGSFSATWSIGLWLDESFSEVVLKNLKSVITDNHKTARLSKSQGSEKLPEQYLHTISLLKNLSPEELEDTFMRSWLITKSKMGFKSARLPRLNTKLSRKDKVRLVFKDAILWTELNNKKYCIAANGNLSEVAKTVTTTKLLQTISSGKEIAVEKLTASELKLVQVLWENYGLTII